MPQVLLFATTTGYQIRAFDEAARRLGAELVIASDRCDHLDDPWRDSALPVRFHDVDRSIATLREAFDQAPAGVLAVGDRPTVLAARAAEEFQLLWHSPAAAARSRDKVQTRQAFRASGLPVPEFEAFDRRLAVADIVERTAHLLPCVVKPVVLAGSRGVIRADSATELAAAVGRVSRLLQQRDVRALRDPDADTILVERFIPGREYAVEGVVDRGRLQMLALFDKPDPLDGPFFEETIYVTPSRQAAEIQAAIFVSVSDAVRAVGLAHGPVHAECRVGSAGVTVLEVAARPIGGLCARAVRVTDQAGTESGLEEVLLHHALGASVEQWRPASEGSAVMMVPIPAAGIYRGVDGVEDARAVAGVTDVRITAKLDQALTPLPEGASYLGFIFARGQTPDEAETAVREAHAHLRFRIERSIPVL
jgi:biotin carboxylase